MQARGTLRVYLGMAPGVGKTFAMLDEGHRRLHRGTDVVIGFVEDHGRKLTREKVEGLEAVPRRTIVHRGATFTEMDVDAVIARRPQVALIDELAHTNVPGSRNAKRWQDVDEILDAGIDVITTVNIQHLESLNDVVSQITGVRQRETLPDQVVRRADQIELVDMSSQALRRRLAHGNVYPSEKIDAALHNYFREGNLTALRELALLWTADRVDDALAHYRAEHKIDAPWPARERVVVALTGGPEGEVLIRRGARLAGRAAGGDLHALYVTRSDGLTGAAPEALAAQRVLVESLGGTFHQVVGEDVPRAILDFARGVNATQVVIGASRRGKIRALMGPGVGETVVRESGDLDIYVVTHKEARRGLPRPGLERALGSRRMVAGWLLAVLGPLVLTAILANTRDLHTLPTVLMLYLALTVAVALVGGLWPAVVAALACGLLANFFFTPPLRTLTVSEPENALAVGILVAVAVSVALVVDLAARRTKQAARARAEADTLATLAGSVLQGDDALMALLRRTQESFSQSSVAMLERSDDRHWRCIRFVGDGPPATPEAADNVVAVRDGLVLASKGPALNADSQRILTALATQASVVLDRERAREDAAEARRTLERSGIRTALLAAVSHDLRTPLAAIKASVGTLRQEDVDLDTRDQAELLRTIDDSTDRLDALLGNLLDMSRLAGGVVSPVLRPVALDEVLPLALAGVPRDRVRAEVDESLPLVTADPGLLERVLANVVENAVRYSPPDQPVVIRAGAVSDQVEVRVIDRGPGVPRGQREQIFEPFQRLGDAPGGTGVGLGLAVARGFAAAMGGTLEAEDTPGGGLTMVLTLPLSAPVAPITIDAEEAYP